MEGFIKISDGIHRLKIPFDTVYTSVFLIESGHALALVDCATTDDDVDGHIVPSLAELGYSLSDVKFLVLTHKHGDHAGGKARVLHHAPKIETVTEERELFPGISTFAIPGHTKDFIGVLDERSGTLISGDGLQGAGVDKYRTSVIAKDEYFRSLEKIKCDARVKNLLFSHAYEPWYKDSISGRDAVLECLGVCARYVK